MNMKLRKTFTSLCVMAAAIFAAQSFADDIVTATVPITVNVDATVTISPPLNADGTPTGIGIGDSKHVSANVQTNFTLQLNAPTSISHRASRARTAGATVSRNRGTITLDLSAEQYAKASVSLYSTNGRRIMNGRAAAAKGAANISRRNVAAGVYLLSVRGANGNVFSTRLTHSGGNMNIKVAFGGARTLAKQTAQTSEYGEWTVSVAPDNASYQSTSFTITPTAGQNTPVPTVVLVEGGGDCDISGLYAYVDGIWPGASGRGLYIENCLVYEASLIGNNLWYVTTNGFTVADFQGRGWDLRVEDNKLLGAEQMFASGKVLTHQSNGQITKTDDGGGDDDGDDDDGDDDCEDPDSDGYCGSGNIHISMSAGPGADEFTLTLSRGQWLPQIGYDGEHTWSDIGGSETEMIYPFVISPATFTTEYGSTYSPTFYCRVLADTDKNKLVIKMETGMGSDFNFSTTVRFSNSALAMSPLRGYIDQMNLNPPITSVTVNSSTQVTVTAQQ